MATRNHKNTFTVGDYVIIRNNKETRKLLGPTYKMFQKKAYYVTHDNGPTEYSCIIQDTHNRPFMLNMWNRHLKKLI